MRLFDLDLLQFCRDPKCDRTELHEAHGKIARAIKATKTVDAFEVVCRDCGFVRDDAASRCDYCGSDAVFNRVRPGGASPRRRLDDANDDLIEVAYAHIGGYVPVPIADLHQAVIDDFGSVSVRAVQRAVRVLVGDRRVASIGDSMLPYAAQRNPRIRPPGWYIRYDSPKLWKPGGLRDLMSVVAIERTGDDVEPRSGRRRRGGDIVLEASL